MAQIINYEGLHYVIFSSMLSLLLSNPNMRYQQIRRISMNTGVSYPCIYSVLKELMAQKTYQVQV